MTSTLSHKITFSSLFSYKKGVLVWTHKTPMKLQITEGRASSRDLIQSSRLKSIRTSTSTIRFTSELRITKNSKEAATIKMLTDRGKLGLLHYR
jgi:hypothetical protein